jgi:hypothetical protein
LIRAVHPSSAVFGDGAREAGPVRGASTRLRPTPVALPVSSTDPGLGQLFFIGPKNASLARYANEVDAPFERSMRFQGYRL